MSESKAAPWVVGTALLSIAILAAGWLLLVSPRLESAAQTANQAEQIVAQNDVLRIQTAALREQFENIEEYKAQVAALRTQIPEDAQLTDLSRGITALAAQAGVTLISFTAGDPAPVVPAVSDPAEPAAEEPASGEDASGENAADAEGTDTAVVEPAEETEPAPTDGVQALIDGFVAIPLTISVLGPAPNVQAFTGLLQTQLLRLVLVNTWNGAAQDVTEPSVGRPATQVGDLEMVIGGFAWVLRDTSVVNGEPVDGEEEPPAVEPMPSAPGANPFAPTARSEEAG